MSYSTLLGSTSLVVEYFVLLQPEYPLWRYYLTSFYQIIPTSLQLWKMSDWVCWRTTTGVSRGSSKDIFQQHWQSPQSVYIDIHIAILIHRDSLDKFDLEVHNGIELLLYIFIILTVLQFNYIPWSDWLIIKVFDECNVGCVFVVDFQV